MNESLVELSGVMLGSGIVMLLFTLRWIMDGAGDFWNVITFRDPDFFVSAVYSGYSFGGFALLCAGIYYLP